MLERIPSFAFLAQANWGRHKTSPYLDALLKWRPSDRFCGHATVERCEQHFHGSAWK